MGEVFEQPDIVPLIVLKACVDLGVGNSELCNL